MDFYLKYLGHASFMMNMDGKKIYIDPFEGEYTEKADLILITHSHHDHCDVSKITIICKDDTTIIAPADCASNIGEDVKTLKPGEKTMVENVTVKAVEAYNFKRFRAPGTPYHPRGLGVGYILTAEGKTVYHAGDTDFIPEMNQLGKIDLALLPSGGTFTMDLSEAVEAVLAIKPSIVIPMHTRETDLTEFKKEVEAKSQIKVVLLKPGQQFKVQ
jgi:L-ascorbate metabolism protein UlaG (beta-lactamase superfamily)